MFLDEKLPVANQTLAPAEPVPPREIHIYPDRESELLCIKPRGELEQPATQEVVAMLRIKGLGTSARVMEAAHICERYGRLRKG
jgi:hypothetical protein